MKLSSLSLLVVFLCCVGCRQTTENKVPDFVESFSSGRISARGPFVVTFTDSVPVHLRNDIVRYVTLKPHGDVTIKLDESARRVLICPEGSFASGKKYRVCINLADLFEKETVPFVTHFSIDPPAATLSLQQIRVKGDECFADVLLQTNDYRDPQEVEKSVEIPSNLPSRWVHDEPGVTHSLVVGPFNKGSVDELVVRPVRNTIGLSPDQPCKVMVPALGQIELLQGEMIPSPERCIVLSFSCELDPKQDLRGIVRIQHSKMPLSMNVQGNHLRIYLDNQTSLGEEAVVAIDRSLQSKEGFLLGEDITHPVPLLPEKPMLRFAGNSSIVPLKDSVNIPFQVINLKAVRVKIFRIYANNIASLLQNSNISGQYTNLSNLAFPVACRTLLFDQMPGFDPHRWNTYVVDIKKMVDVEPGAVYHLELSIDKRFAVYRGNGVNYPLSVAEVEKEDRDVLQKIQKKFEQGEYYTPNMDVDWSQYRWNQRDNPAFYSYYVDKAISKNILTTDLAIVAKSAMEGTVSVLVNNISNATPEQGVTVTLYDHQNQPLSSGQTNPEGVLSLSYRHSQPLYVIARKGSHSSYLRLDNTSELSLSDFDVSGERVAKGVQGFLYGDRDLYRPGDTLAMTLVVRDPLKTIPDKHPVVFRLTNPLGQLYQEQSVKGINGFYQVLLPTTPEAITGKWNLMASVGDVVFTKKLSIETIKPNRLKVALLCDSLLVPGENRFTLNSAWLTGAVSAHLQYDVDASFSVLEPHFDGYNEYLFQPPFSSFAPTKMALSKGVTNTTGGVDFTADLRMGGGAPGMLKATILSRVYEASGEYSINETERLYSPYASYVGMMLPASDGGYFQTDNETTVRGVNLSLRGKPIAQGKIEVTLYKTTYSWWWSNDAESQLRYMSDVYNNPVWTKECVADTQGQFTFPLSVATDRWGSYYLEVLDVASGHKTGATLFFDSYEDGASRRVLHAEKASLLSLRTDKQKYNPKEKVVLSFPAVPGAQAVVTIEKGGEVLKRERIKCRYTEESYSFEVTPDMQPNVYASVSLIQPYGQVVNDLPIRLYGVVPVMVESEQSHLYPVVLAPDQVKPNQWIEIDVSEKDGREMTYTLAIVDEGLLGLSNFKTPNPWNTFYAKGALGVSTWDSYHFIFGAYAGKIEQAYSIGGDASITGRGQEKVNRFESVAINLGVFTLPAKGNRTHRVQLPSYIGDVRVMVVAANKEAAGSVSKNVKVFNPMMVLPTLPRLLYQGDECALGVTVFAMEEGLGEVDLSVATDGAIELLDKGTTSVSLVHKGDTTLFFRVKATKTGVAKVVVTGKSKNAISQMPVQMNVNSPAVRRSVSLFRQVHKDYTTTIDLPGVEGSNKVQIELSGVPSVGALQRIESLVGYPYSCLEQLVSSAFPLLYLEKLTTVSAVQTKVYDERIRATIAQLPSYQNGDGSLSYWPSGSDASGWGSVYAANFLIEASARGYTIPTHLINRLMDNVSVNAQRWSAPTTVGGAAVAVLLQSYRLYVLSLDGRGDIGSMNRLSESKELTPVSAALLSMAYLLEGRSDKAMQLLGSSNTPQLLDAISFGSPERNMAIELMANLLIGRQQKSVEMARMLSMQLSSSDYMSTQTSAFVLIALGKFYEKHGTNPLIGYQMRVAETDYNETSVPSAHYVIVPKKDQKLSLSVVNTLSTPLFVRVTCSGMASEALQQPSSSGLSLTTRYVDAQGAPIDVKNLKQSQNFFARTTLVNLSATQQQHLAVTLPIACGWEVDSRFYQRRVQTGVSYADIRDNRVDYFIDHLPSGGRVEIETPLTATYRGVFFLPSARAEAMYQETINANTGSMIVKVEPQK